MISAMEKGVAAARLAAPPQGIYQGYDLRGMPQYACYKAAALLERLQFKRALAGLATVFAIYFLFSRLEVHSLSRQIQQKENVLALAVQNLTQGSSESVADQYIESAVSDFMNRLGNFTPAGIEQQYASLAQFMAPQLATKFQLESREWIDRVKTDQITEILTIQQKKIQTNGRGQYQIVAFGRTDSFVRNEHIGFRDEAIEMDVRLLPPSTALHWRLEITRLRRGGIEPFKEKQAISQRPTK
jgi:hypothetical protein